MFARTLLTALLAALIVRPAELPADQAQYFYDELGRLAAVVDGQGRVAIYVYDEVGNLLRIERPDTGGQAIGIHIVTPASARKGTAVTIQGFGFDATPSANQVTFGGTAATVLTATPTSLTVSVPDRPGGLVPVSVTSPAGTATKANAFTVLVPPIIVGTDTQRLPRGVTSRLLIEGFNLAAAQSVVFRVPGTTTPQPGLTTTILAGGTDTHLPITVAIAPSVPLGAYEFIVTTPAGTTQSGTIQVRVVAAAPTVALAGAVSVIRPLPAQVAPSGPGAGLAPPVSVVRPGPEETAPSGPSAAIAPSVSVLAP